MLKVLCHAHLPHKLVLVPVHTGQGSDMREDVLKRVGELEGVHVTETELHMGVDDKLRQAENLATQVEGVSETRLLAFFRRERPERP